MNKGRLISIEGVDGVGKTTLAQGLAVKLDGVYYKTPGGASDSQRKLYDQVGMPIIKRFRFYMDCYDFDLDQIEKHRQDGRDVFCDRFITSTLGHHRQMDPDLDVTDAISLDESFSFRTQILLVASRAEIINRLNNRKSLSRFEEDQDLFTKTQNEFLGTKNDLVIDTSLHDIENTLKIAHDFILGGK